MWKHIPSKGSESVLVKPEVVYRVRHGSTVNLEFVVSRHGPASYVVVKTPGGAEVVKRTLYTNINRLTLKYVRLSLDSYIQGGAIDIWEQKCPNGVTATPEQEPVKFPSQKFIIWCPTSNVPPRVILETEETAKEVALDMARRHKAEFYWARLEGKVTSKQQVTYTEVVTVL